MLLTNRIQIRADIVAVVYCSSYGHSVCMKVGPWALVFHRESPLAVSSKATGKMEVASTTAFAENIFECGHKKKEKRKKKN